MKDSPPSAKRRRYDAAFRAEALRLASKSCSTQAAARALNIDPKRIDKWQKEALTPVAATRGAELDPATAAELRQLRVANRRQAQELEILKKPSPVACYERRLSQTEPPGAVTALSRRNEATTPCARSASWCRCLPVATMLGNRFSSKQSLSQNRLGKPR